MLAFFMKIRELAYTDYNQVIEIWKKSFSNNFDKNINTTYIRWNNDFLKTK